jgi:potassium-transporting ATPase KdpC subunit
MIRTMARATVAVLVLAVLTGLVYPLTMTGLAQVALGHTADGSLVQVAGRTVGSALIGQAWAGPEWFYGRPSAVDYDAATSSGSNLGPRSRPLADEIRTRASAIVRLEGPYHAGLTPSLIPADLLTASGSGLDPDVSPAAARFQAPRIAAVRSLPLARVLALIRQHTQGPTLGFLGEPRVDILDLNVALARMQP